MAQFMHSKVLFVQDDGNPIHFYMAPGSMRNKLRPYIEFGGGEISNRDTGQEMIKLAATGHCVKSDDYINSKYIMECVERNQLLDIDKYRLQSGDTCESSDDEWLMTDGPIVVHGEAKDRRGRNKYFREDDLAIIRQLIDLGEYENVKGRRVWTDMEDSKVLKDHTWQSMKSRYLNTILPNIHSYGLSNMDMALLSGNVMIRGSSSPEKSRSRSPQKTPRKKPVVVEKELAKKLTPKTPSKVPAGTTTRLPSDDVSIDMDELDEQLLQFAQGSNGTSDTTPGRTAASNGTSATPTKSKTPSKEKVQTPKQRSKSADQTSSGQEETDGLDGIGGKSLRSRTCKKTNDVSKVKNHQAEDTEDSDGPTIAETNPRKRRSSALSSSPHSKRAKKPEDETSPTKRLSLRGTPKKKASKRDTSKEDDQPTTRLRSSQRSSDLPDGPSTRSTRAAETSKTGHQNETKSQKQTDSPKKSSTSDMTSTSKTVNPKTSKPAAAKPSEENSRSKTIRQSKCSKSSEVSVGRSASECSESEAESEEHTSTRRSTRAKQTAAQSPTTSQETAKTDLSVDDIFRTTDASQRTSPNNQTLQNFIMEGSNDVEASCDEEMDQKLVEKIKTVSACLELEPGVIMHTLHRVSGDLEEAIHWILHGKTKEAGVWNKHYDRLLTSGQDSDLEELQRTMNEAQITLRRKFLDK